MNLDSKCGFDVFVSATFIRACRCRLLWLISKAQCDGYVLLH